MALSSTQKNVLSILVAVFVVSMSIAAMAVAKWGFSRSRGDASGRGITVVDSAQVKVRPDTAFITFGVVNKDKSAKIAARTNAQKTSAVIEAIKHVGISKFDIKTVDYMLEPSMNWEKNPPIINGYEASNLVRVRTKDIGKIADLIDAAIDAGANNVQGVSFDIEDKRKLRQRALTIAVKKAQGKAQAIADALGSKLGQATSASESVDVYMPESRNMVVAQRAKQSSTPIEPGETTVSAQVKVVYSLQ